MNSAPCSYTTHLYKDICTETPYDNDRRIDKAKKKTTNTKHLLLTKCIVQSYCDAAKSTHFLEQKNLYIAFLEHVRMKWVSCVMSPSQIQKIISISLMLYTLYTEADHSIHTICKRPTFTTLWMFCTPYKMKRNRNAYLPYSFWVHSFSLRRISCFLSIHDSKER